jgi:hypothetical protein
MLRADSVVSLSITDRNSSQARAAPKKFRTDCIPILLRRTEIAQSDVYSREAVALLCEQRGRAVA